MRDWFASLDPRVRARVTTALIALLIGGGVSVTVSVVDDDGAGPKAPYVNITVGGAEVQADRDNQLEPAEQHEARDGTTPDVHEDTRDETPGVEPGSPAERELEAKVERGKDVSEQRAEKVLEQPREPAGAQLHSCPAAHVRNQSALSQKRVGTALHFTVSDPGSLLAIRGLFDRRSFGASSNYGIELTGRCQQWVPEGKNAWAQGAANSAYVSIEIICCRTRELTRAEWLRSPLLRDGILASLVRDIQTRAGAPNRLVDPVGCVWPAGVTDHDRLECGNTHWDVGKNFPWDVFIRQLRQGGEAIRKADKWCRGHRIVHAQIRDGRSTAERRARNRDYHRLFERDKIKCRG